MSKRKITRFDYHKKGFKWYIYNVILGVSPVLFLWFISYLTNNRWGAHTIENLLYKEAILLFVSCILMGAIMIDFWMGEFDLTKYQGLIVYAVPPTALLILFFQYFLLHENIVELKLFDMNSTGTTARLAISSVYCIFAKSYLYLREERKEKQAI